MAKTIRVGPQFEGTSQQGPQVDEIQFKSVMRYIELGKSQGAKVMAGGDRALAKGFYVQPTVFADVTDEMTIAKEEVRDRRHSSILISCSTSTIFRIVTLSQ